MLPVLWCRRRAEPAGCDGAARQGPTGYPKVDFLPGGSGKPQAPGFAVFDLCIQEPANLSGSAAGGMSKRNKVGPVGGFAIPEVNRLMNAFIAGARETDRKAEVSISVIS